MASDFGRLNWRILEAIISGPFYATILLLIPFGMLTAIAVVLDPGFIIYEFLPEELLFIPWLILSALISMGNIHVSNIRNSPAGKNKIITITNVNTHDYLMDQDKNILVNIAQDIYSRIEKCRLSDVKSITIKERDYGLDIVIEDYNHQIISIALSSSLETSTLNKTNQLIVELLVCLEPPFIPWKRIKYNANIKLKETIESILVELLNDLNWKYTIETS